MCFRIHSLHQKEKIAKKDITCYKVLRKIKGNGGGYKSLHQGFRYKVGKNYTSVFRIYNSEIFEGLHSFTSLKKANTTYYKGRGLVKCVIPKGSTYYYDPNSNEYVSNKIRLIKKIK